MCIAITIYYEIVSLNFNISGILCFLVNKRILQFRLIFICYIVELVV